MPQFKCNFIFKFFMKIYGSACWTAKGHKSQMHSVLYHRWQPNFLLNKVLLILKILISFYITNSGQCRKELILFCLHKQIEIINLLFCFYVCFQSIFTLMRPYKTMLRFFRFKPHTAILGVSLFLGMTNGFPVKIASLEDQTKMQECNAISEYRNGVSILSQCLKVSNSDLLFENFILFKTLFAIDSNIFEAFEHRGLLAFAEAPEEKLKQQEFVESIEKAIDYNKDTKNISFDRSEKNLSFFLSSKVLSNYRNIFIILFNEILKSKIADSPPIFILYRNLNKFISTIETVPESAEKLDAARHRVLVTEARDFKQHFESIFLSLDQYVENEYFDLIFRSYNMYKILCSLMEFYCDFLNPNLDFKDISEAKRALNNCCNFYYHRILWNLKIKFSLEDVHYCINVGIKKYIVGSSIFATYVLKTIKFLKEYLYEVVFLKSKYNENLTHNTSEEAQ